MDQAKRERFIARFSRALDRDNRLGKPGLPDFVEPFDFSQGPQEHMYEDLNHEQVLEMFFNECDRNGTKYVRTSEADLAKTVLEVIAEWGNGKVIFPKVEEMDRYGIRAAFEADTAEERSYVEWDAAQGREYNIQHAQNAEIGLTFPMAGIAETATVIQPSDAGSGRSISLLPLTNISIVRSDTIVPRMTQSMDLLTKLYRENPKEFPSNITHISGPSNTADIELVRVVGVHGPINVTYIVVE